ncbi:MAG: glycosyltransferase [Thermoleophilia bacterium]
MTRVSLVLATVGRVEQVERMLGSVAQQRVADVQVVLVDQNDDDRLVPLVTAFAGRFDLVHLRSERGLSRARNAGLRVATGQIMAFPDDDAWYPLGTLASVLDFFERHPQWDGLSVRAIAERSMALGRWDTHAGPVDRTNVWKRGISFGIFLRRGLVDRLDGFDETLGVGASTPWGSGEETDYLIRALGAGGRIWYDPAITVGHPPPPAVFNAAEIARGGAYGRGFGRVLRLHDYPARDVARFVVRPLLGAALALGKGRVSEARYRMAIAMGRLRGWRAPAPEPAQAHPAPAGRSALRTTRPASPLALFNGACISAQPTGIGVVARDLAAALDPGLVPLLDPLGGDRPGSTPIPDDMSPQHGRSGHMRRLAWTQRELPDLVARSGAPLLLSPIPEAPLARGVRSVVLVHDLLPLRHPHLSLLLPYHAAYVPAVLHRAVRVLCNSEATADEVHRRLRVPERRLVPIKLGFDPGALRPLGLEREPFFLLLGRHDPHKNLRRVLRAFAALPARDHRLVVVGPTDPRHTPGLQRLARDLGVADRCDWHPWVDDHERLMLLNRCRGLVLASRWEGFGLPALEAMACGTPVIASNAGALPEVVGDAALVVDPEDTGQITAAMETLVNDGSVTTRLAADGLRRAAGFSWDQTARQVEARPRSPSVLSQELRGSLAAANSHATPHRPGITGACRCVGQLCHRHCPNLLVACGFRSPRCSEPPTHDLSRPASPCTPRRRQSQPRPDPGPHPPRERRGKRRGPGDPRQQEHADPHKAFEAREVLAHEVDAVAMALVDGERGEGAPGGGPHQVGHRDVGAAPDADAGRADTPHEVGVVVVGEERLVHEADRVEYGGVQHQERRGRVFGVRDVVVLPAVGFALADVAGGRAPLVGSSRHEPDPPVGPRQQELGRHHRVASLELVGEAGEGVRGELGVVVGQEHPPATVPAREGDPGVVPGGDADIGAAEDTLGVHAEVGGQRPAALGERRGRVVVDDIHPHPHTPLPGEAGEEPLDDLIATEQHSHHAEQVAPVAGVSHA